MINRINRRYSITLTIVTALGVFAANALRAQPNIVINEQTKIGVPPTPISLTGFTGEVESVLSFDLTVMGFVVKPVGEASYELSGNNAGNVTAQLTLTGGGSRSVVIPNRMYTGAPLRNEAHRLADDVVAKISGVPGIAEVNGQISKIAFKVESGPDSEIYVSDFDGHNASAATEDHNLVAAPCWVPGHFALYYTSYKLGSPCVFFQDLRSGTRRNFSDAPGMIGSPAVSPDGRKVALVLARSGSVNIYVADADNGKNLKQLTFTAEDNSSPCWSPDGKWICFASKVNERRALSKVPAEGGRMERIPTAGVSNPSEPDWSPDGKWIAFTSQYAGGFNLCVVSPDGTGDAIPLVSGEDPSWAANSRTLVFVRRGPGGNRTLSLLDVPTKQVKDVPRVSGSSNSQPSWAK